MTTSTTDSSCIIFSPADVSQSPYYSVNYSYGMLLGVDDFQTEWAYHSGKMRLHNQWLHREGVVWGYNVALDSKTGVISVSPGLALDGLGRELHVDTAQCLDVAAWFAAHRNDSGFTFKEDNQTITFDAYVVIRFKACLTRQVPAFADPCEGATTTTAYSRLFETVEILLRPGSPPADPLSTSLVYHRLRLFFGLDAPVADKTGKIIDSDQQVLDAPKGLANFQKFAALDEIDLAPPNQQEYPVLLALIPNIILKKAATGLTLDPGSGPVDVTVRPSHVATAAIQELLCGTLGLGQDSQIIPGSWAFDATNNKITFRVTTPLLAASVAPAEFSFTYLDPNAAAAGWQTVGISTANFNPANNTVTISLAAAPPPPPPSGSTIRFIAICSGPTPLMGANNVPLNNGRDFVLTQLMP